MTTTTTTYYGVVVRLKCLPIPNHAVHRELYGGIKAVQMYVSIVVKDRI